MSLYHETAAILAAPSSHGGSLKSRIFSDKSLKSPPAQVYALAFESSKWSAILKEVLTPALSILLVHDLLLSKKGIALPPSHGLRLAVEKHKARLQAEFTRARVRRKCATVDDLRVLVDAELGPAHPRWIRINALKATLDDQLDTTFRGFEVVPTVEEVVASANQGRKVICLDGHVPNLVAASPGIDFTKTEAYKSGAIILQDKASCFPAYLLDPRLEDGDVIDACSAPGNKTTHLAAILHERREGGGSVAWAPKQEHQQQRVLAFEKDKQRAEVLKKMVHKAGAGDVTAVHGGADFLQTDPDAPEFRRVGALLLDPSCSGSGIVGRDDAPVFHLPSVGGKGSSSSSSSSNGTVKMTTTNLGKRKRPGSGTTAPPQPQPPSTPQDSTSDPTRLASLSAFQLTLVQHAFRFPSARKITYSTCSIHAEENEHVVLAALASDVARSRGWRIQRRDEQVRGMLSTLHRYPPIQGYVPNEWPLPVILGAFGGLIGAFVLGWLALARWLSSGSKSGLSGADQFTVAWFSLCGFLHLFFEGYFVLNHATLASSQTLFSQLWKEYGLSDSRYLSSDPFMLCIEALTVLIWAPLSLTTATLTARASRRRSPAEQTARHLLQVIVCIGHLYGVALYYGTCGFAERMRGEVYSRPEFVYYWVYYAGMNAPWAVVPFWLLWRSAKAIQAAFGAMERLEEERKGK
ncbi:hypothetical protein VTJ49DRAFT_1851 [Mycothermus thermophilus]|uniref:Uncharacterized protein n=1 Tax=Humicola insolens TaxID=85995 RepID=A0ABR3VBD9_HUMIN